METESVIVAYEPVESVVVAYGDTVLLVTAGGLHLIVDRTYADVANRTAKGFYNASDLNRVGQAVHFIASYLSTVGILVPVEPKMDWELEDIPSRSQMDIYLSNIRALQEALRGYRSSDGLPDTMDQLTIAKANNIERILEILDAAISNIILSYRYYSGRTISGVNSL